MSKVSPAVLHLLSEDRGLVYVVVEKKSVFDQLPFALHDGEVLSKAAALPDGRGVIFQFFPEE